MRDLTDAELAQLLELLHQFHDEYSDLAGARPLGTCEHQSHRDEASGLDSRNEVPAVQAQHDLDGLHQIGQALARAAQNHYGLRIDYGNPIRPARLASTPYAARCVACQVQYERNASGALG